MPASAIIAGTSRGSARGRRSSTSTSALAARTTSVGSSGPSRTGGKTIGVHGQRFAPVLLWT